jgi:MFS family permease
MAEANALAFASDEETRALRHVSRRFLWFLFILLMINFVDRTNVGFAALSMNHELGISASMFGLAVAMFSTGYMICEIPSNMILARVGARRWLSRIVISWGLASMACAFVMGAQSLVAMRFVLGVAEAGFFPGVILFITYWYPQYYRARAQTAFMVAQPMANAVGAMLSGVILGLDGVLGIAGWRWIFLLEGLPAVLLGVFALYYLTDRPEGARWLSAGEKAALASVLARDAAARDRVQPRHPTRSLWRQVLGRNMLLMSFCFGTMVGNFNALAIWMPQIIRGMTGPSMPYWLIGLLTAIPPLCTLVAMPFLVMALRSHQGALLALHSADHACGARLVPRRNHPPTGATARLPHPCLDRVGRSLAALRDLAVTGAAARGASGGDRVHDDDRPCRRGGEPHHRRHAPRLDRRFRCWNGRNRRSPCLGCDRDAVRAARRSRGIWHARRDTASDRRRRRAVERSRSRVAPPLPSFLADVQCCDGVATTHRQHEETGYEQDERRRLRHRERVAVYA